MQKQADDAAFIDVGVGYQMNNWLRFDFTAEHRAMAKFKVLGSYQEFCAGGTATCFDQYDGSHSAEVFLANAYLDLGTWWCLTPFVGVGVGGAWNTVSAVTDVGFHHLRARLRFRILRQLVVESRLVGDGRLDLQRLEQSQARVRGALLESRLGQDGGGQLFVGRLLVAAEHRALRVLHAHELQFAGLQARHALDVPAGGAGLSAAAHPQGLSAPLSGHFHGAGISRAVFIGAARRRSRELTAH